MGQLPPVTFVSFGKPKAMWQPIVQTYEQRLAKATRFQHVLLREKGANPAAVKAAATKLLDPHIGSDSFVVVFDERGKSYDSPAFAKLLASARPKPITAVIGTSYGLAEEVLSRADRLVSLGAMTLPHEIARATALEQIYRADTILSGHPYHHS